MDTNLETLVGLRLDELEARRDEVDKAAIALHQRPDGSLRNKTTGEQKEFDSLLDHRDAIDKRIKEHTRIAEIARTKPNSIVAGFGGSLVGASSDVEPAAALRMRPDEARDAALRVVERHGEQLSDDARDQMDALLRSVITENDPNCDGSHIAKRTLVTESPAYRSAFRQVMTDPHPVLTNEEATALRSLRELDRQEYRAMSEGTPSAGGYGVPVFLDPTIILTGQQSLNPFVRIAKVVTVTSNVWKGVSSAGVSWSFDAEAARVSDDSPTLDQPAVNVHTARGFVPWSIEVGGDYPGFAEEMASLLAAGYDELLAEKFAVGAGDGSNEPFGIITALDSNTNVEVAVTTDGTFSADDINKVWNALPDRSKAKATWVMSYDVGTKVSTFGNGQNAAFVTVDLTDVVQTLRTRPVEYSSYFPSFVGSTTTTNNVLVVGDFSNYLIAQRAGMSVELVPHLFQQQTANSGRGLPTGERGFFAWARTGGDSINDAGFRMLQS